MQFLVAAWLFACGPPPAVAEVDVVVVGSGAGGVCAALAAREEGARVLVLDRADEPGGSSMYGGVAWAADSRFAREAGEVDSVDMALEEWTRLTIGGDPDDPAVRAFVADSAGILEWLVDDLGVPYYGVARDEGSGTARRNHSLGAGDDAAIYALLAELDAELWTGAEVVDLEWEGGAVTGVRYLDGGTEERVRAEAVVVATGGFARDVDRVYQDRADLVGIPLGFDHAPGVDGGGHRLVEDAGGQWHNPGGLGVYVKSIADWRPGHEGELVYPHGLPSAVVVDPSGRRVGSEEWTDHFAFSERLAEAGRLVAVYPRERFESGGFHVAEYNMGDWESAAVSASMLYDAGVAVASDDLEEVALAMDVDPAGLAETVAAYEGMVEAGEDTEFGKARHLLVSFGGRYAAIELRGGTTKAFSGWRTDEHMRVLDASGAPVPGLYGAGEVIGFLGTEAVGRGFTGSMTAVYWGGLRAGRAAALD